MEITTQHEVIVAVIAAVVTLITNVFSYRVAKRRMLAKVQIDSQAAVDTRWKTLCDEQQERLDQMTRQLATFQTRLGEQEQQIADLWTRLHQSEIAVSVRDTKIVALEASGAAKDLRIAALESKVAEMQEHIRVLEEENSSLKKARLD